MKLTLTLITFAQAVCANCGLLYTLPMNSLMHSSVYIYRYIYVYTTRPRIYMTFINKSRFVGAARHWTISDCRSRCSTRLTIAISEKGLTHRRIIICVCNYATSNFRKFTRASWRICNFEGGSRWLCPTRFSRKLNAVFGERDGLIWNFLYRYTDMGEKRWLDKGSLQACVLIFWMM